MVFIGPQWSSTVFIGRGPRTRGFPNVCWAWRVREDKKRHQACETLLPFDVDIKLPIINIHVVFWKYKPQVQTSSQQTTSILASRRWLARVLHCDACDWLTPGVVTLHIWLSGEITIVSLHKSMKSCYNCCFGSLRESLFRHVSHFGNYGWRSS